MLYVKVALRRQIIYRYFIPTVHDLDLSGHDISYIPDVYDVYDLFHLAHVAGWEPCNLDDLGHASWVGYVSYKSCAAYHNGK